MDLSPEEQEYISSLPIADRPLAIYQLSTLQVGRVLRFIRWLRER